MSNLSVQQPLILEPLEEEYQRILGEVEASVERHIPNITDRGILWALDVVAVKAERRCAKFGTNVKLLQESNQTNLLKRNGLLERFGGEKEFSRRLAQSGIELDRIRGNLRETEGEIEEAKESLAPIFQHNADPNNVQIRPDNVADFAPKTFSPLPRLRFLFSKKYRQAYHVLEGVLEHEEKYEKLKTLGQRRKEEEEAEWNIICERDELNSAQDLLRQYEEAIFKDGPTLRFIREQVYQNLLKYPEYAREFAREFKDNQLLCNTQRWNQIKEQIGLIVTQQQVAAVTAKNSGAPGCNF